MDRKLFADAAYEVYGPHWIAPIAQKFGVLRHQVERWEEGLDPIPAHVPEDLVHILRSKADNLEVIAAEIEGQDT